MAVATHSALRPARRRWQPLQIDEDATQRRLQELLLSKNVGEDPLAEATGTATHAGGHAEPSAASGPPATLSGLGRSLGGARKPVGLPGGPGAALKASRLPSASPTAAGGGETLGPAATAAAAALAAQEARELDKERKEFVEAVCSENARYDVQEWVGKIFTMMHQQRAANQAAEAKERRRRKLRARTCSATSDAGASGYSVLTGDTGQTPSTGTALLTAGGSIAAMSHRPPKSVGSDESLVVHHNAIDEPLSVKERIQAYLARRIPELEAHVNEHVAQRTEALQHAIDKELGDRFLRQTAQRRVFDSRANFLRWQNARHQVLQKRLDEDMEKWILEAIEIWDQKKAMESQEKDVSDTDLIFEYLTKRAAHIDSGKLPTEIPIFKTLHASYSLPSMWRDKY